MMTTIANGVCQMKKSLSLILAAAALILAGGYMMGPDKDQETGRQAAESPVGEDSQEFGRDKCIENCS